MKKKLTKKEQLAKLEEEFLAQNKKEIKKFEKQSGVGIRVWPMPNEVVEKLIKTHGIKAVKKMKSF